VQAAELSCSSGGAVIVTEDLTSKVVAWATEIARYAAQLPSRQARDDYLRERRRDHLSARCVRLHNHTPRIGRSDLAREPMRLPWPKQSIHRLDLVVSGIADCADVVEPLRYARNDACGLLSLRSDVNRIATA
jgi:hypothetical protein